MADSSPPRPRRLRRAAVAILVLLFLAGAALWEFLPYIVESVARARLVDMGVPDPELTVRRVGPDSAEITGVALGSDAELTARRVTIDYELGELVDGQVRGIAIEGATLRAAIGPDGLSLGSLDPLLGGAGDGAGPPALPPIRLEDARAELTTAAGPVTLNGGGTVQVRDGATKTEGTFDVAAAHGSAHVAADIEMRDGAITGVLELTDLAADLPDLASGSAAGTVAFTLRDGLVETLDAALALHRVRAVPPPADGLGYLAGSLNLSGGPGGWRGALELATGDDSLAAELRVSVPDLELDSGAAIALEIRATHAAVLVAQFLRPAPSAGSVRMNLVGGASAADLVAWLSGAAAPPLAAAATLEIEDATLPDLVESASVIGGFDLALDGGRLRIDAPAPILGAVTPAPAFLNGAGLPPGERDLLAGPLAFAIELAGPATASRDDAGVGLEGGFRARLEAGDSAPLLDLQLAGSAFISGSGVYTYNLPDMSLDLDLPISSTAPGGRLALTGSASGRGDRTTLQGDAALSLVASMPALSLGGFGLRDLSAELPVNLSLVDGRLAAVLRQDGRVSAARVAGPTPIDLEGRVTLPLRRNERPLLIVETGGSGAPRTALDLSAGPLRLSGSVGTEKGPLSAEAMIPSLRLSGADNDGAWSGTLRVDRAGASLPGYQVAAEDVEIAIDFASGEAPRIALDAALTHQGEPAYVVPLRASLTAREVPDGWAFAGTIKDADERIDLAISGRHDVSRQTGSATLKLAPLELIPDVRRPEDYAPWLEGLAKEVSGSVALAGDVAWTREIVSSDLKLLLRDLSADTGAAVIERMNGVIAVDGLLPFSTPAGQRIAVAMIDVGLPLTDGLLTFRVVPGPRLEIAGGTLHLAGGTVEVEPLTLDPAGNGGQGVLLVEGVQLGELLALAGVNGLTGSGRLSGRIPVVVENEEVMIAGGVLDAEEPGFLSYAPLSPPAALQGQGETVSLALSALTNFQYQALRLTVDRQAGGEMTVTMHVRGSNPDFYDGYPVEFNLNVSGALDRVLRDSLAGYRIPETIEERLNEFTE